jgi:predicted DCC family thiol-disulfide oxidoreductase YuxK
MMVWKLFYDGGCNLCHTSKLKVEKWAAKAHQSLEVDILQSDEAINKGYPMDGMVLEVGDQVYYGADAWFILMKIAPWYLRGFALMRYTPFTRWLGRWGYGVVAKYRYKWFGTRACPIPKSKNGSGTVPTEKQPDLKVVDGDLPTAEADETPKTISKS